MISDEMIERATRAYLVSRDIDPDMPHGLERGAQDWWKVNAPHMRAALEAALQPAEAVAGIVERLNTVPPWQSYPAWEKICAEAADTIVRLAAERDEAIIYGDDQRYRASNAEAERNRLREALRDLCGGVRVWLHTHYGTSRPGFAQSKLAAAEAAIAKHGGRT